MSNSIHKLESILGELYQVEATLGKLFKNVGCDCDTKDCPSQLLAKAYNDTIWSNARLFSFFENEKRKRREKRQRHKKNKRNNNARSGYDEVDSGIDSSDDY